VTSLLACHADVVEGRMFSHVRALETVQLLVLLYKSTAGADMMEHGVGYHVPHQVLLLPDSPPQDGAYRHTAKAVPDTRLTSIFSQRLGVLAHSEAGDEEGEDAQLRVVEAAHQVKGPGVTVIIGPH